MVKIEIRKEVSCIMEFSASGHTNFEMKGYDIVDAAISVLTQTAILGLERSACINVTLEIGKAYVRCSLPSVLEPTKRIMANAILETMLLGLEEVARQYPENMQIYTS